MKFCKNLFLTGFLLITLTFNLFGQVSTSICPEFGLNLANVNVTPSTTTDSRTGLIISGLVDINIGRIITATSGMRFIMKGYSTSSGGVNYKLKFNYLEFPALIKTRFQLTEVKPYLLGGPVLGINLSATSEQTAGNQSQSVDVSGEVESIDLSLLFGGGIDFRLAPKLSLFAQFGYQLGLTNWLKNAQGTTAKNYGIQLTSGVRIKI
jgi:hypothetical protein